MTRSRIAAFAASGALALAFAACGGGTNPTTAPASSAAASQPAASSPAAPSDAAVCAAVDGPGEVSANARQFAFSPATVNVTVGQSVTWANGDSAPHSVVLDGGECQTEQFGEGKSGTLMFNVAGSYPFHCGVHPTMVGTVEVAG